MPHSECDSENNQCVISNCYIATYFTLKKHTLIVFSDGIMDKIDTPEVSSVTFLISVNNSWKWVPPFDNSTYLCVMIVKSDPLHPNTPLNKSENITLGNCDNGSLVFTIHSNKTGHAVAVPVFHSTNLEPVYPPTCSINWNYSYLLPTKDNADESLLPRCTTSSTGGPDGIQTVSYSFSILDWDVSFQGIQ